MVCMGSLKLKDATEFRRLMRALALDVDYARIHWRLYQDLSNALEANPWIERNARTFWSLTLKAHQESALTALCRAFDSRADALSLGKWIEVIRDHLHLFDVAEFDKRNADHPFLATVREHAKRPDVAILDADAQRCSRKDPTVSKLIVFRGNVTAHRSALGALNADTEERAPPPMFVEIEQLLERAGDVLNTYTVLFSAETFSATIVGAKDYMQVIKPLAAAIEDYEKQITAEYRRLGLEPPGESASKDAATR